jgi:hypothetical protein
VSASDDCTHCAECWLYFRESFSVRVRKNGRSGVIRTRGPGVPNAVLHRAELHSEIWRLLGESNSRDRVDSAASCH